MLRVQPHAACANHSCQRGRFSQRHRNGCNQDELALQGQLCGGGTDGAGGVWQAWANPLAGGATAALLLSRNASVAVNTTVDFR